MNWKASPDPQYSLASTRRYQTRMNWKLSLYSLPATIPITVSNKNELKVIACVWTAMSVINLYQTRMNWKMRSRRHVSRSWIYKYQTRMNWKISFWVTWTSCPRWTCIKQEWIESFTHVFYTTLINTLYQTRMNWKNLLLILLIIILIISYQTRMNWKGVLTRGGSFSNFSMYQTRMNWKLKLGGTLTRGGSFSVSNKNELKDTRSWSRS